MKKDCCKNCERRHEGCHADCKDYIETFVKGKEEKAPDVWFEYIRVKNAKMLKRKMNRGEA